MVVQRGPRVLLRWPDDGDRIVLPMGDLEARIVRKASRSETGGHWAFGEAWQDPGFDNRPTPTTRQKPSMSWKVRTPSTPTPIRQRG
jgi:hypothetical protein